MPKDIDADDKSSSSDSTDSEEELERLANESTTKDDAQTNKRSRKKRRDREFEIKTKEQLWKEERRKIPKVVDVKWLDFEHFKNAYGPKEGLEIIEVLRGHNRLSSEALREQRIRSQRFWQTQNHDTIGIKTTFQYDISWAQRVRIQSPQLLLMLSRLTGHEDAWGQSEPHVFFRPFRAFYYFLPQVKKCLKILEARWGKEDPVKETTKESSTAGHKPAKTVNSAKTPIVSESKPVTSEDFSDNESDLDHEDRPPGEYIDPEDAIAGEITDSLVALQHVRKFVQFVDENIVPEWEKAKVSTTNRKIRFYDLWMYYNEGELLYAPIRSETGQYSGDKTHQSTWRLATKALDEVRENRPDDWLPTCERQIDFYGMYRFRFSSVGVGIDGTGKLNTTLGFKPRAPKP